MVKPTLLVLAAGMGSRYGSLKQMDGVGPNGEAILDYSVFDAARAGFGKVVFVIRHSFEEQFRNQFSKERFGNAIDVDYVFQELDILPEGFAVPENREKPWGTNHAIIMAHRVIHEPFAVINADDFYGQQAYAIIADYLRASVGKKNHYCMVGYKLENTLSEFGAVSRGICKVNRDNNLVSMQERTRIERIEQRIVFKDENGDEYPLDADVLVSMNLFGFTPDYFTHSWNEFAHFLRANDGNLKSEFYIPSMVNKLVSEKVASMRVLTTEAQWFGVTYKEDRPFVVENIRSLIDSGVYPEKLWK